MKQQQFKVWDCVHVCAKLKRSGIMSSSSLVTCTKTWNRQMGGANSAQHTVLSFLHTSTSFGHLILGNDYDQID